MDFVVCDAHRARIYCDGKRTVCKLSAETHRPAPWSERFRQAMETFHGDNTLKFMLVEGHSFRYTSGSILVAP